MNGLLGFIITAIFGFGITFLFDINFRKLERFALSILLGFGVQTLFMFIFYLFGLGFTLMNTLLEMFILSTPIYLLCIFLGRWPKIKNFWLTIFSFRNLKKELVTIVSSNPEEKIFIIFVLGLLLVSLIIGTYFPVSGWDSLVLYDFRAVTFVATGGMADGIARGYFFGYPLMTSLAHTWMYFVKGNPHVFYWGIYLAFIVVIYECLKSFLGSVTTKITTLVLITLPFVFTGSYFDYTNFPYLVYIVTSVLYIIRFSKDRKSGYLILASILVGLSTWIRETEPFWIVNLLAIITVIIPGYRKRFVFNTFLIALCLFVFFAIQQPWKLYETKMIGGGRNVGDQAAYAIKSLEIFDIPRFIDVAITTIKGTVSK